MLTTTLTAEEELEMIRPYACVRIAAFIRSSVRDELNDEDDDTLIPKLKIELAHWDNIVTKKWNLANEQWEKDRKDTTRWHLKEMVEE